MTPNTPSGHIRSYMTPNTPSGHIRSYMQILYAEIEKREIFIFNRQGFYFGGQRFKFYSIFRSSEFLILVLRCGAISALGLTEFSFIDIFYFLLDESLNTSIFEFLNARFLNIFNAFLNFQLWYILKLEF